jgi:multidrug efflux pump
MDADKLAKYSLTPSDIRAAITSQNAEVTVGQLGANTIGGLNDQVLNVNVKAQSLMTSQEQFENILLKVTETGQRVLVKDVARVAIGSQMEGIESLYNGHNASGMGVTLAPGANGLETAKLVKAKMEELSRYFPDGMAYSLAFDSTPPVLASIHEVVKTLLEAIGLVFLVMLLFLQSFRATIIPTLVIPVALLGTFLGMWVIGFTINQLTLFAMVLAIGIVVDDAIVVIENVERIMSEEHMAPKAATQKAMTQITGAVVAITVVLAAVFIPSAMQPGAAGAI